MATVQTVMLCNDTTSVKLNTCLPCVRDIAIFEEQVNMCLEKVLSKIFIADIFHSTHSLGAVHQHENGRKMYK